MSRFLVIGATGKTGGRVAERLAVEHEVRAASRSGQVRFDWADPSSYRPALDAVDGIFLTVPGQSPEGPQHVAELLELAADGGVGIAVLLSARAVEFHPQGALARVEEAVRDSSLAHTILRPAWFAQNFTEGFLAPDEHGVVTAPTGDGREPFIDLEDVADVAVAALTGDGARGTIGLSGSEALSFADAVVLTARAWGRAARFEAIPPNVYRAQIAAGLPAEYVEWRMAMFDAIRSGRDAYLSSGVQDALGRPARSFSAWARDTVGSIER